LLIKQAEITNYYLKEITNWIKISDEQKIRLQHINEGLQFLNLALSEGPNSEWWDNALKYFKDALTIKNDDYFTNHQIALIYFWSKNNNNFEKALFHFLESAKYAYVYYKSGGSNLTSINPTNNSYLDFTIDSYFLAADTAYWMQDINQEYLQKAIIYLDKILSILPNNPKAAFLKAKYLTKIENNYDIRNLLIEAIHKNKYLFIETLDDADLMQNTNILTILQEIKYSASNELSRLINEISTFELRQTSAEPMLETCLNHLQSGNYYQILEAIEILNCSQSWKFKTLEYTNYYLNSGAISIEQFIKVHYLYSENVAEEILFQIVQKANVSSSERPINFNKMILNSNITSLDNLDVKAYLTLHSEYERSNKLKVLEIIEALEEELYARNYWGKSKLSIYKHALVVALIDYYKNLI
jgi:hypothetical protein